MSLMTDRELSDLEDEARVIQSNFRGWLYRRNFKNVQNATRKLQQWTRKFLKKKEDLPTIFDISDINADMTNAARKIQSGKLLIME